VDQALTWEAALTGTSKNESCISDAPHALPSVLDATQQIVSDIQSLCRLPAKSQASKASRALMEP
jgi:hypothetical protein